MDVDEVIAGGLNVISEVSKLEKRFGVITDLLEFVTISVAGRMEMGNIMKHLKDSGVGNVVRVVPQLNSVEGSQCDVV